LAQVIRVMGGLRERIRCARCGAVPRGHRGAARCRRLARDAGEVHAGMIARNRFYMVLAALLAVAVVSGWAFSAALAAPPASSQVYGKSDYDDEIAKANKKAKQMEKELEQLEHDLEDTDDAILETNAKIVRLEAKLPILEAEAKK